jgi:hypothetical protein
MEQEGHAKWIMDRRGVNFFEMWPVFDTSLKKPTGAEIIGTWLEENGKRDEVISIQIAGPNLPWHAILLISLSISGPR